MSAIPIQQPIPRPSADGISRALLEAGLLTPKQLAYAQRVHAKLCIDRPLLDILRELFPISDAQVRDALRKKRDELRLGDLLLELGYLRQEFLELALAIQREGNATERPRIGEVLIDHHLIDEHKLVEALALHLGFALEVPGTEPIAPDLFAALSIVDCERHSIVPLRREPNGVVVAYSDPTDPDAVAAAETAFGADQVVTVIAERSAIRAALSRAAGRNEPIAFGTAPPPAIVDLLDELLGEALEAGASAIHLEPRADGISVRLREGGMLASRRLLPLSLGPALANHLRFLCRTLDGPDPSASRSHFGHQYGDLAVSVVMASCPSEDGDRIVLHLVDVSPATLAVDALGLAPKLLARLRSALASSAGGLWLVAGPGGSGRTTSLHAWLGALVGPTAAIATIESAPVRRIEGAAQLVLERAPQFAKLFARALQQDPDVLGIDVVRSAESAQLALSAASAGRRVIAVVGGEDAAGATVAFASQGADRPLLASSLSGVLAQQRVRRVCAGCAQPDGSRAARQLEELLGAAADSFRVGVGCTTCHGNGHPGSIALFELLVPDAQQRGLLARGCSAQELREATNEVGSATLFEDAVTRAAQGHVSAAEIARVFATPESSRPLAEILARMDGSAHG